VITGETTLAAARRLLAEGENPAALIFASAKNPGGGFLNGAQAQEEACSRASALYACQTTAKCRPLYAINRGVSCLYTDNMIYSPAVPVFRDDHDKFAELALVSFITAPCVNAGVERKRGTSEAVIQQTMQQRIARLLTIAAAEGHTSVVLGAWGCGVFGNHPSDVARAFMEELAAKPLNSAFKLVVFAIPDERGANHVAFAKQLADVLRASDSDSAASAGGAISSAASAAVARGEPPLPVAPHVAAPRGQGAWAAAAAGASAAPDFHPDPLQPRPDPVPRAAAPQQRGTRVQGAWAAAGAPGGRS
jgi:uncharacterized protein (TIGR02452 family)